MKITLVSPHTKGPAVLALQRQLAKHGYLQGDTDAEFGPDTARAVYRAKYWLGYRKPDQVAGDLLYSLLKGTKKPNPAMKARIIRRNRLKKKEPIRLKMWRESGKYIGMKESPFGSNKVLFSFWYGVIGAWCAMFVSYNGVKVGSLTFKKGKLYAYCPYIVNDAKAGRNNLAITYKPETGNLVLFDWDNDGVADHIGLFGKWINQTTFSTREGNTGHTNASNGGEVLPMERNKSDVVAFVHVGR